MNDHERKLVFRAREEGDLVLLPRTNKMYGLGSIATSCLLKKYVGGESLFDCL